MQAFHLSFSIPPFASRIRHQDPVLLTGSCFTEHIGNRMEKGKIRLLQNPHGILFNPMSIARSLQACIREEVYTLDRLFFLNELWNSWDFHSRYSHPDPEAALEGMNASVRRGAAMIREAAWLVVTFGSAYQYFTRMFARDDMPAGVANCHKAPGSWFEKRLLDPARMYESWKELLHELRQLNPGIQVVFTVSPVRHIRDGLAANNRSKGRLLELAHALSEQVPGCSYFPAYELVIDVLRDYRFFEADMVHPNSLATDYVWEQFRQACLDTEARDVLDRLAELHAGLQHRPRFPGTDAYRRFKAALTARLDKLAAAYPWLDLREERTRVDGS